MSAGSAITLVEELIAPRLGSVDPSKYPGECFDLYSIPSFDTGEPDVVYGAEIGSAKQLVETDDVLLSRIVPHIRRAWVVGPARGRRLVASGEWIVFRSDRFDSCFLRHLLISDSFHSQFMRTVSGVGGSLLRARPAHVVKIRVPLPSLAEQRRIAEILDKADALRAKRRAALAQLDALTQSIFLDMFGDPITNKRGWRDDAKLGDVAEIVSGVTKGRSLNGKPSRTVPYLAVANVQDRALRLGEVKMIDATEEEIARYRLRNNDLLLTEGGDPDKLGRGSLWTGQLPECIHQNHVFRVRITSPEIVPLFLNWLVSGERGKRYFLRSAKQTTGIASINMTQLRGFPLLIPPIEQQELFAEEVGRVSRLRTCHVRALRDCDALFSSLQHRAFRGEL